MKTRLYLCLITLVIFQALSCKKDMQRAQSQPVQQVRSLENGLITFSANGQLVAATIDTSANTILVTVQDAVHEKNVTLNFNLASGVIASINGTAVSSGVVTDVSNPVTFTVTSTDKTRATSFKLVAQTEMDYIGLVGNLVASKSLDKNYSFYFDQFDGSEFAAINCGPTSTTMAIKWADSTFAKKPVDARDLISPGGGWWDTGSVSAYLNENGISNTVDTLADLQSLAKTTIDNDNILILCLDMYYVPYNQNYNQHISKFYFTNAVGWGHFIVIKGYMQLGTDIFLDAYDPYSDGMAYSNITAGQLMGKDRYYFVDDLKIATQNWWPYAIIVAPKGLKVISSTKLTLNSISKPIPVAYGR